MSTLIYPCQLFSLRYVLSNWFKSWYLNPTDHQLIILPCAAKKTQSIWESVQVWVITIMTSWRGPILALHFYWPLLSGIHWSSWVPPPPLPTKGQAIRNFDVFFDVSANNLSDKHSSCRWFDTPWRFSGFTAMNSWSGYVGVMSDHWGPLCVKMTSSNGSIFRVTGPLCGEFTAHWWIPRTNASHAELWCFLWFFAWIKGWVNNREAGDLRRNHAYYDVIVMYEMSYLSPDI